MKVIGNSTAAIAGGFDVLKMEWSTDTEFELPRAGDTGALGQGLVGPTQIARYCRDIASSQKMSDSWLEATQFAGGSAGALGEENEYVAGILQEFTTHMQALPNLHLA